MWESAFTCTFTVIQNVFRPLKLLDPSFCFLAGKTNKQNIPLQQRSV